MKPCALSEEIPCGIKRPRSGTESREDALEADDRAAAAAAAFFFAGAKGSAGLSLRLYLGGGGLLGSGRGCLRGLPRFLARVCGVAEGVDAGVDAAEDCAAEGVA